MKFTVTWLPEAEEDLAAAWLDAPDREAVTQAASYIDKRLRVDPVNDGESRPEGRRIMFATPLGVLYRVSVPDCLVEVLHLWHFET